jgi:hypothetical protein
MFAARFEGGPRDGTWAYVRGTERGEPPDIVRSPGRPDGLYLLAGGTRRDGRLPYWWMSRRRLAYLRSSAGRHRISIIS